MSPEDQGETRDASDSSVETGIDERIFKWTLLVGIPFLIGFTTWLVIILAFAQWKIY